MPRPHDGRAIRLRHRTTLTLALAATSLLVAGLGTPAEARPAPGISPAGPCSDVNARVVKGKLGHDPNDVSAKQAAKAQKKLHKRLARFGYDNRRSIKNVDMIKIPVRFHIILRDNGTGGVSTDRIKQQMRVINKGFSGRTSRAAAKTPIKFFLKKVDRTKNSDWYDWSSPDVDPADDNEAKAALGKNPDTDLNVYVANLGDGLLGYATFPWERDLRQGLVILNASMPGGDAAPYNEGDTATHEIGHWLGLYHTFQDGCTPPGDYVKDTPYQLDDVNVFFCEESDDTCKQPGKDPVHNFMSYGDDPCLDQFTKGQSKRMVQTWLAWRNPDRIS